MNVLESAMIACDQMPGYSVLQHGIDVADQFRKLVSSNSPEGSWKLPDWYLVHWDKIITEIHPEAIWEPYTRYHDCGKPHCRVVDDQGKVHFPDHAATSARVWLEAGGDPKIAKLIANDMVVHTIKAADIPVFCETHSRADVWTLLIAALAEIHANCRLFGGIESTSFKSKWTQIDRRGKAICKLLFGEVQS